MNEGSPIRDEAFLALCAGNRTDGEDALNDVVNQFVGKIRWRFWLLKIVSMSAALGALISARYFVPPDLNADTRHMALAAFIMCLLIEGIIVVVWQKIQHNAYGLKLIANIPIPVALQQLIAEYGSGARRVYTWSGTVPKELFLSHWAILLFSNNPEVRGYVRSANARRETKEIYAVPKAAKHELTNPPTYEDEPKSGENDETPNMGNHAWRSYKKSLGDVSDNLNVNTDDYWITDGSRAAYEAGRSLAVAGDPPHRAEQKSFCLDGIRHELRTGGQRGAKAHAKCEIEKELTRVFGQKNVLYRVDAIAKMMSAGAHNASLRAHFSVTFLEETPQL